MKKSILKKTKKKLESISDDIDEIGLNCTLKEGESEDGEALWSSQRSIEEAISTLKEQLT